MKLSIIIPVYNCEAYLEKCFDSLLQQEFHEEYEILVVNDGSTDGSQVIIDAYAKKYPQIFNVFVKENGGLSSARNLGLDHANGEFISFVDSDDWLDSDYYSKGISLAESTSCDVVVYDMYDHYPTYTIHHKCSSFENRFKMTMSAANKLFRRSAMEGFRFPLGLWYEDLEFTARIFLRNDKVLGIQGPGYHCHCRAESIMTNHNATKNLDILEVFDHLLTYAKEHNVYEQYKDTLNFMMLDHILITSINRVAKMDHPQKQEVIKKLKAYVDEQIPNVKHTLKQLGFSRNRYLIAMLNEKGMHQLSKRILAYSAKRQGR